MATRQSGPREAQELASLDSSPGSKWQYTGGHLGFSLCLSFLAGQVEIVIHALPFHKGPIKIVTGLPSIVLAYK